MKVDEKNQLQAELDALFPGRVVQLTKTASIRVFPVSLPMMGRFAAGIARVVAQLSSLRLPKDVATGKVIMAGQWSTIGPVLVRAVTSDLFDLVAECTQPCINDVRLPHWFIPPIITAWLEENFQGEEKLHPWVAAVENAMKTAGLENLNLWETFSRVFSTAATPSKTSSIAGNPDSRTTDGLSPNSATGRPRQGESSSESELSSSEIPV